MFSDSDPNNLEEDDVIFSDNEESTNEDEIDVDFDTNENTFMPQLLPNEELSSERQEKLTNHFCKTFDQRYPSSGLIFFQGSFDNALNQSIFNLENPRPLLLYIRHDKSVVDNIFCMNFFCSTNIVNCLNSEFIIWPWDRSNIDRYRQFLQLLIKQVGSKITSEIAAYSYSEAQCPLLVCLAFEHNQYTIVHSIDSRVQEEDMMLNTLYLTRDDFDKRNNPNSTIHRSDNEIWYIPNSHLKTITSDSDQFRTIINNLNIEERKILRIRMVENIIWSVQYSTMKNNMEDRAGYSLKERQLFYGCPLSMAENILRNGFDYETDRIHGDKYGSGFYFSSTRELFENYKVPEEFEKEQKAIIQCRILIDQDQSTDSNIVVVCQNQQILPEYLIVYRK